MKKSVKYLLIGALILLGILGVIVIVSCIPILLVLFAYFFAESPEKPEIKYGEFDYSLVYEINGETKTINDILVCEYAGILPTLEGKVIEWESYIKGTKKEDKYLISENDKYRLYIYIPTDARYFMDDPVYELYGFDDPGEPWFVYEYVDGTEEYEIFTEEEYAEKFGAKIISWQIDEPIENSYKK